MSDDALRALCKDAGVASQWKDVFGKLHEVEPPTMRAVIRSLGMAAESDADIRDSRAALSRPRSLPPLITAEQDADVELSATATDYELTLEDGRVFSGRATETGSGCRIPAILEAGYHGLLLGGVSTTIAVAPPQCFTVPRAIGAPRGWGVAVQLYALRRKGDAGIGDFTALAEFATSLAAHGAQAIGISPVHAQFSADPDRFSPYAPSTRTALNILHTAIDMHEPELEEPDLIDWPAAARFRLSRLRAMFEQLREDRAEQAAFAAFRASQGDRLIAHAVFEALHAHLFGQDASQWHWRSWPTEFTDPAAVAVLKFAEEHAREVDFHAWLQFRADRGLSAAQAACRSAGMGIGLVSDLAVGTDSGGSQCWSRQQETLLGLSVGAPPDLLQREGQNWGLTAFSPRGLVENGFLTYRDMLQTAMAHAGGMRIDHAMGLNRLWVIPEGASGAGGTYLSFPEQDLLRLIKLESWRHRAIVLAEDLGTVPEGFQDRLRDAGIDGMRVLWFERTKTEDFVPPDRWTSQAAAMTSTHDLPTVAGWWSGRDLEWREELRHATDPAASRDERAQDRVRLWEALVESGAASGDAPPADAPDAVVDAACLHVGSAACELVMLPIEDAIGLKEQPNLPGTVQEHPNWRRRLPPSPIDAPAASRLRRLDEVRRRPPH